MLLNAGFLNGSRTHQRMMNENSCYSTPRAANKTHRLSRVRLQCTEIKTRAQPTKGVRVLPART